jgi:hypothetical protein
MGLENRLDALKNRHHELDAAIELETTRACPDEQQIHHLKKEKLRIKDEITALA